MTMQQQLSHACAGRLARSGKCPLLAMDPPLCCVHHLASNQRLACGHAPCKIGVACLCTMSRPGYHLEAKSCPLPLEAIVQIHLPPNHAGTILIHAFGRVCNVSTCRHEQIVDDASASLASCQVISTALCVFSNKKWTHQASGAIYSGECETESSSAG
jgi:hypothetical protein